MKEIPPGLAPSQPWLIVAAFPTHHPRTIGRTRNRSDAEAMVRFLQRKIPNGSFSVVFAADDSPTDLPPQPSAIYL